MDTRSPHSPLPQQQWLGFDSQPLTPLSPRYRQQLLWQNLLLMALVILLLVPALLLSAKLSGLGVIISVTLALLLLGFKTWLNQKQAEAMAYGVCEYGILLREGLWWQIHTAMPASRLQHVSLSQGPLQRHFGLTSLRCYSAGSSAAEVSLPGLDIEIAEALRQHLLSLAGKDGGETSTETPN
ncbi:PH domain-containing protein [Shewanella algae]|uniref:PH domain-containing protein n=1 Tax=Shewanella algae TaxID=38313 RepID=UPI0031F55767